MTGGDGIVCKIILSFRRWVVNTWNSLPNWVVTAESTNIFKTRLDIFWHNQDFRARTGSRSEI